MAVATQKSGNRPAATRKAMSAEEFRAWLSLMGITATEASLQLGVSKNTITAYRQDGADERVRLACRALARAVGKVRMVDIYEWEEA